MNTGSTPWEAGGTPASLFNLLRLLKIIPFIDIQNFVLLYLLHY